MTYCHNHYVIHRDLKLENVMLADAKDPALKAKGRQVLKLIDFGARDPPSNDLVPHLPRLGLGLHS